MKLLSFSQVTASFSSLTNSFLNHLGHWVGVSALGSVSYDLIFFSECSLICPCPCDVFLTLFFLLVPFYHSFSPWRAVERGEISGKKLDLAWKKRSSGPINYLESKYFSFSNFSCVCVSVCVLLSYNLHSWFYLQHRAYFVNELQHSIKL